MVWETVECFSTQIAELNDDVEKVKAEQGRWVWLFHAACVTSLGVGHQIGPRA